MATENCTKCKLAVGLNNSLICENNHLMCSKCVVKSYNGCPNCHAEWKNIVSNEKVNEIRDENYHALARSASYTLINDNILNPNVDNSLVNPDIFLDSGNSTSRLSPKRKQFDYDPRFGHHFINLDERQLYEAMNSTSGEKQKLNELGKKLSNCTNTTSNIGSHTSKYQLNSQPNPIFEVSTSQSKNLSSHRESKLPKRTPNILTRISGSEINSQKCADNVSKKLKSINKESTNIRQQFKETYFSDQAKNSSVQGGVFMVTNQFQKPEGKYSFTVPSQKEIHIRNSNLNKAVKMINQKEEEISKQRRLKREQIIAEQKAVLRQKILEEMQNNLLEETPGKKTSNYSTYSATPLRDLELVELKSEEDINCGPFRIEKVDKIIKKKKIHDVRARAECLTSTIKEKSSFKAIPCSDTISFNQKPKKDPMVKLEAPKGHQVQIDSKPTSFEKSSMPTHELVKEKISKNNISKEKMSSQDVNTRYLKIDVATSPRIDFSVESPSREVENSGASEQSGNFPCNCKDSSSEPLSDFDPVKLYCRCSSEDVHDHIIIESKSSQTELEKISETKSTPSFHFTLDSKETTKTKPEIKFRLCAVDEINREKLSNEKTYINPLSIDIDKKVSKKFAVPKDIAPKQRSAIQSTNINVKSNVSGHFCSEKDLDKVLESFIKLLLKKKPKMTLSNIQEILNALSETEMTGNSLSKNLITIDLGPKTYNNDNDNDSSGTDGLMTISSFKITNRLTNAWQAFSRPLEENNAEPLPQIRMIQIRYINNEIIRLQETQSVTNLNINRNPLNCPISTCKGKVFISEFTKHIKLNHVRIAIETISPGVCRNLLFDCKLVRQNLSTSQILYLVTNKISDFGSNEFRDYLPVLLMTTKVSLFELINSTIYPRDDVKYRTKRFYYLIWLTGLVIRELPVYYTIVAWNRKNITRRLCHLVNSGKLYSFRENQSAGELYKTGQALIISQDQCDLLTDSGKNMMELQIILH